MAASTSDDLPLIVAHCDEHLPGRAHAKTKQLCAVGSFTPIRAWGKGLGLAWNPL